MEPDTFSAVENKRLALELVKDQGTGYSAFRQEFDKKFEKTKRNLLLAGVIGLVVGQTNLVPSKIDSLGISFDQVQQANFRYVLAAVIAYFLFTFSHLLQTRRDREQRHSRTIAYLDDAQDPAVRELRSMIKAGARPSQTAFAFDLVSDVILPYFVGAIGLAGIFHLLPKWLLAA
jgi:hypothetical protein